MPDRSPVNAPVFTNSMTLRRVVGSSETYRELNRLALLRLTHSTSCKIPPGGTCRWRAFPCGLHVAAPAEKIKKLEGVRRPQRCPRDPRALAPDNSAPNAQHNGCASITGHSHRTGRQRVRIGPGRAAVGLVVKGGANPVNMSRDFWCTIWCTPRSIPRIIPHFTSQPANPPVPA